MNSSILLYALLALLGAHYVADFAMQNAYVAAAKADRSKPDWFHALTGHAVHHAVAATVALWTVYLGTGVSPDANVGTAYGVAIGLGIAVGASHWFIDYGKAVAHLYGYHSDQFFHVAVSIVITVVSWVVTV